VTSTYTVGIDTGGTFTDSFIAGSDGEHWTVKVPTTAHDLTVCFADAIDRSAAEVGLDREPFLRRSTVIRFSSTVATNTALTLSGPKLGLIVTAGEERSLYGAGSGPDTIGEGEGIFRFVPADMVAGIGERVSPAGVVEAAPDPEQIAGVVKDLLERGARILVVSLANADANPSNEAAVFEAINGGYPRHYLGAVPTLLSTHVSPAEADGPRTTAAVVNAYMHGKLARSLYKAEDDLRRTGFGRPLLAVGADGTVSRVAKTRALSTYQSGPASGVHAGALLASASGVSAAVTADVGGTSTDLSVVLDRGPLTTRLVDVGGLDVAQPSVELVSIAMGGGSICAVVDGEVTVGPASAGSAPGPACFGLGGQDPTPTDAWLALGYLDPDYYLGGRATLSVDLARSALERAIASPLGVSVVQAALAVKEATERTVAAGLARMLERPAIRDALDGRGVGDLALIAFGGGGGILLPSMARTLGIPRVLLSSLGSVLSAFGVNTFDVRHRYEARVTPDGNGAVSGALGELVEAARRDVRGEGFAPEAATITVSVLDQAGTELLADLALGDVEGAIARAGLPGGTPVIVSVSASCEVTKPDLPRERPAASPDPSSAQPTERDVVLPEGPQSIPIYRRELLGAGHVLPGPCLIESSETTILVPAGTRCEIDALGTAVIT
jgi:N-methylhydantoinase A/acetophenone carboxylase